jgi:two-component system nitrate/nitrite response regulator NarL
MSSGSLRSHSRTPRRSGPIRIVSADDQPLFRDALARAVQDEPVLELVDQAADAPALRASIERLQPDVALVDAALLAPAVDIARSTRVVVLVAEVDAAEAYAAVEVGVAGYLSKDLDGAVICRAAAAVGRGETVLDPAVQTRLAAEIRLRARDERPVLSAREHEILVLIAEGRSAPEIARRLRVGTTTVKTHLLHLYSKLGVAERAAAVAEAMRRGLLE